MPTAVAVAPRPEPYRLATIGLAALAWFGVLLQLVLSLRLATLNGRGIWVGLLVYSGFFTILTNILVAVALTTPLATAGSALGRFFGDPGVLAGVATRISLVGLGYHALLRELWDPQGMQWVADAVLHYAVPIGFVAWWFVVAPKARLRYTSPLRWALWPLAYVVYAFARGAITGLDPYPAIDVAHIGYGEALMNAVELLAAFLLLALAFLTAARMMAPRRRRVR
jgi:hypothetical protein